MQVGVKISSMITFLETFLFISFPVYTCLLHFLTLTLSFLRIFLAQNNLYTAFDYISPICLPVHIFSSFPFFTPHKHYPIFDISLTSFLPQISFLFFFILSPLHNRYSEIDVFHTQVTTVSIVHTFADTIQPCSCSFFDLSLGSLLSYFFLIPCSYSYFPFFGCRYTAATLPLIQYFFDLSPCPCIPHSPTLPLPQSPHSSCIYFLSFPWSCACVPALLLLLPPLLGRPPSTSSSSPSLLILVVIHNHHTRPVVLQVRVLLEVSVFTPQDTAEMP